MKPEPVSEDTSPDVENTPESTVGGVLTDSKKRSWIWSHQHHIYGWGAFILAILVFFVPNWPSLFPSNDFDPDSLNSKLEVRVLRNEKPYDISEVVPLVSEDKLQISGRFDKPVYAGLVWVDQDGNAQLLATNGKTPSDTIRYPADYDKWTPLKGDPGTEIVFLAASGKPITEVPQKIAALQGVPPKFKRATAVLFSRTKTEFVDTDGKKRSLPNKSSPEGETFYPAAISHADLMRDLLRSDGFDFQGIVFPHQ